MKQAIVKREQRGDVVMRHLECNHEQVEPRGGEAPSASHAFCRVCSAGEAREAKVRKTPPPAPPPEKRSELQRLAADVEAAFVFPAGRAWGRDVVAVRKLVDAAKKHECSKVQ